MARLLHEKGYPEVWPLLGGFDAWVALGYPVERHPGKPSAFEALSASSPSS